MSETPTVKVTFAEVVNYLSRPEMIGDFPTDILENRLRSIGTPDVLDGAIATQGFPFKYHSPLDEGIMILNYFLRESQRIRGSYIQINSTHVPNKEEENTLASWKSPKAGLYLDLHALIENHNLRCGRKEQLKRLFVFRDHAQLAFLESSAIGVILEQESIGIKTGFLIDREKKNEQVTDLTWAGVLLVQLICEDDKDCRWFLGVDKALPAQHPYRNDVTCRWHTGRMPLEKPQSVEAQENSIDLDAYLDLFKFIDPEPEKKTGDSSYEFETDPNGFRRLLQANYEKAFPDEKVSEEIFGEHLKYRAIPANLEQFHLALKEIGQSVGIKAIDASSTKNTLRVHEADPNYRHWIRASVQCALKDPDSVSLERVYILDEKKDEYAILKQEIDLYRRLMSRQILRLDKSLEPSDSAVDPRTTAFPRNIRLYAITRREVEKITREASMEARTALAELLREDFERKEGTKVSSIMPELDFLYSERLVFNYKDYKGEPGRAFYDADLFMPRPGNMAAQNGEVSSNNQIFTYLDPENFEERRSKYARLFEMLKRRSVRLLPNDRGVPSLADFARELENAKPITISEVLGDSVIRDDDVVTFERVESDSNVETGTINVTDGSPLIFMSYAKRDRNKVKRIIDNIEAAGCRTWDYLRDVAPGSRAIYEEEAALATCDFFIACHSKDYGNRQGESEIEAELDTALKRAVRMGKQGRFLIVLMLDQVPVRLDLKEYWQGDLFAGGTWQDEVFQRLLECIKDEWKRRNQK